MVDYQHSRSKTETESSFSSFNFSFVNTKTKSLKVCAEKHMAKSTSTPTSLLNLSLRRMDFYLMYVCLFSLFCFSSLEFGWTKMETWYLPNSWRPTRDVTSVRPRTSWLLERLRQFSCLFTVCWYAFFYLTIRWHTSPPSPPTLLWFIHPNILPSPVYRSFYWSIHKRKLLSYVPPPLRIKGKRREGGGGRWLSAFQALVKKYWMMWDESNWISHISIIIVALYTLIRAPSAVWYFRLMHLSELMEVHVNSIFWTIRGGGGRGSWTRMANWKDINIYRRSISQQKCLVKFEFALYWQQFIEEAWNPRPLFKICSSLFCRHSTVVCWRVNHSYFLSFSYFFLSLSLHKQSAVRPVIVRPPQDTTALLGGEVTLECGVSGDPPPHVEWRRQDGAKIPINRIRPASNDQTRTSLRLERLVASDAGRYVCEVENSVGSSSASAQLAILIPVWIFNWKKRNLSEIYECFGLLLKLV